MNFIIVRESWYEKGEVKVELWNTDALRWERSDREYREVLDLNGVTFLCDMETGIVVANPSAFETNFLAGA